MEDQTYSITSSVLKEDVLKEVETGRALYVKGVWMCLCAYYSICVGLCAGMIKRE